MNPSDRLPKAGNTMRLPTISAARQSSARWGDAQGPLLQERAASDPEEPVGTQTQVLEEMCRQYLALFEATFDAVFIFRQGICIDVNPSASSMFDRPRDELIGTADTAVFAPEDKSRVEEKLRSGCEAPYQAVALKKDGTRFHVRFQGKKIQCASAEVRLTVVQDIDAQVKAEAALREGERHLRSLIESASNKENELKERSERLSEVNTALEVLLRKREADRQEVEEKLLANAQSLILPYLEKLKASRLDERQRVHFNLVESNLNEIISPLTCRMSRHYLNFTPMEIQVANLVKEGKTTKDIANIMGLSSRTIEAVRYTIRRKLGLKRKGANLRSYLLSFDGADNIARRYGRTH